MVIDEEQHFGVSHREQLKKLKSDVHVLTLTATPIPRTLQMALTGVREMSIIATPPIDRLAVRTFVLPYDPVVVREAILRERFRGGQTFYVCPRIADLTSVAKRLKELLPDIKTITAHGQMTSNNLEDAIGAFYDRKYDVLLSTNIIESGIDMPQVNTMIIHRADMFGLSLVLFLATIALGPAALILLSDVLILIPYCVSFQFGMICLIIFLTVSLKASRSPQLALMNFDISFFVFCFKCDSDFLK